MTCSKCKEEKTYFQMNWKTQSRVWCKDCVNAYNKSFRDKNSDKVKIYELNRKRNGYKITLEEYNKLLELQGGVCAICRNKDDRDLSIDHNHLTKDIRGLLCSNCNLALGHLKEDENIIWNMLEYLKRTTWSKIA